MMVRLLLDQKALRSVAWLPIGVVAGVLLVSLQGTPPPALPLFHRCFIPQYFFYPTLFFLMFLIPYMLSQNLTGRCGRMELTLPLSSRTAWLSHITAVTVAGLAILFVATAVLVAGNLIQGKPAMQSNIRSLIPNVAAGLILFAALAQIPRPRLYKVPSTGWYITYLSLVGLGILVLISVLSAHSPLYAILPLVVAAVAFVRVYRALPLALTVVAAEPDAGDGQPPGGGRSDIISCVGPQTGSEAGVTTGVQPSRWTVHSTVLRTLYNPWLTAILFVILIVLGSRNSGFQWSGVSNLLWSFWVLVILSGLFLTAVARMYTLDPFPISRRLVFTYLTLPSLAVAFSGYALGTLAGKGLARSRPLVEYSDRRFDRQLDIRVPLEYWKLSWDGTPEPLAPAHDEPHAAWSVRLFRGTDTVLYNPYHAPEGSSPEFVASQLSRAIEAVYGRHISPEELSDRYLESGPDGGTTLKVGRMDLGDDYSGLRPRGWSTSLAAVIALIGMAWLLYLAAIMPRATSAITIGHLTLTIGIMFLAFVIWSDNAGVTKPWKLSALLAIMARELAAVLPGGTFTLWGIAVLGLACCYCLAQSRFTRMEVAVSGTAK
jgi:hypothetical protein